MSGKCLTPAEANARLPLVVAVAGDAVALSARLATVVASYRAERRRPVPSQTLLNETKVSRDGLQRELDACLAEMLAADATLADPAQGIVDFRSVLDGTGILLCWRCGEERVEHFHGEDEAHDVRRPLPEPVHA